MEVTVKKDKYLSLRKKLDELKIYFTFDISNYNLIESLLDKITLQQQDAQLQALKNEKMKSDYEKNLIYVNSLVNENDKLVLENNDLHKKMMTIKNVNIRSIEAKELEISKLNTEKNEMKLLNNGVLHKLEKMEFELEATRKKLSNVLMKIYENNIGESSLRHMFENDLKLKTLNIGGTSLGTAKTRIDKQESLTFPDDYKLIVAKGSVKMNFSIVDSVKDNKDSKNVMIEHINRTFNNNSNSNSNSKKDVIGKLEDMYADEVESLKNQNTKLKDEINVLLSKLENPAYFNCGKSVMTLGISEKGSMEGKKNNYNSNSNNENNLFYSSSSYNNNNNNNFNQSQNLSHYNSNNNINSNNCNNSNNSKNSKNMSIRVEDYNQLDTHNNTNNLNNNTNNLNKSTITKNNSPSQKDLKSTISNNNSFRQSKNSPNKSYLESHHQSRSYQTVKQSLIQDQKSDLIISYLKQEKENLETKHKVQINYLLEENGNLKEKIKKMMKSSLLNRENKPWHVGSNNNSENNTNSNSNSNNNSNKSNSNSNSNKANNNHDYSDKPESDYSKKQKILALTKENHILKTTVLEQAEQLKQNKLQLNYYKDNYINNTEVVLSEQRFKEVSEELKNSQKIVGILEQKLKDAVSVNNSEKTILNNNTIDVKCELESTRKQCAVLAERVGRLSEENERMCDKYNSQLSVNMRQTEVIEELRGRVDELGRGAFWEGEKARVGK